MWKTGAYANSANGRTTNNIIRTHGSGYVLGTDANVNTNTAPGAYVMFGVNSSGSTTSGIRMATGRYSGSMSVKFVTIGDIEEVDVIWIGSSGSPSAMVWQAQSGFGTFRTLYFDGTAEISGGAITSNQSGRFVVASHAAANASGRWMYWTVFGHSSGGTGSAKIWAASPSGPLTTTNDELGIRVPFLLDSVFAASPSGRPVYGISGVWPHYMYLNAAAGTVGFPAVEPDTLWVSNDAAVQALSSITDYVGFKRSG